MAISIVPLEQAALRALIFRLPLRDATALEQQIERAAVLKRENTGAGFLTYLACAREQVEPVLHDVTGYDVIATIGDVPDALGFILWLQDGYVNFLETYTMALAGTVGLDLPTVAFAIQPPPEPGLRPRLFADVTLYAQGRGGRSASTPPTYLGFPCRLTRKDDRSWDCRFLFEGTSMKPGETRRLGFIPLSDDAADVLSQAATFYIWEGGIIGEATVVPAGR